MTQEIVPNPPPNTGPRNRRFKVEITETVIEDEERTQWVNVRDNALALELGLDKTYDYVKAVLPTEHKRTVLEAELDDLDVPRVVLAVFGLPSLPQATGLR